MTCSCRHRLTRTIEDRPPGFLFAIGTRRASGAIESQDNQSIHYGAGSSAIAQPVCVSPTTSETEYALAQLGRRDAVGFSVSTLLCSALLPLLFLLGT